MLLKQPAPKYKVFHIFISTKLTDKTVKMITTEKVIS